MYLLSDDSIPTEKKFFLCYFTFVSKVLSVFVHAQLTMNPLVTTQNKKQSSSEVIKYTTS